MDQHPARWLLPYIIPTLLQSSTYRNLINAILTSAYHSFSPSTFALTSRGSTTLSNSPTSTCSPSIYSTLKNASTSLPLLEPLLMRTLYAF